jgi:Putative metallopeptidase
MKLASALICFGLLTGLTMPAPADPAMPDRISVSYVLPKDPAHQPIYNQLKDARFLERVQEFLSPVRLPRTLLVKTESCDGDANAWYDGEAITLCYDYVDQIWKSVPAETTADGVAPIDALVGPILDTCLHEFAHALFDILKIPVFGREEDAADQFAAYVTLQLGKEEARRRIAGTAYAYSVEVQATTGPLTVRQFANEHGTPAQRMFNLLCIAYGADPNLFGDFVTKGQLPQERAEGCADEYKQTAHAFETLIRPHIDERLAKGVMDKSWLPEPTSPVPPHPGRKPPDVAVKR